MIRYSCTACVGLSVVVLSLMLTACGGPPVSVTPPSTATKSPLPSPTPALEDLTANIDRLLTSWAFSCSEGAYGEAGAAGSCSFTGAVLVARNDEIVLSKGYDLADRDKQLPNTPQTKYRLASITKQFTAMAILILQTQGRLNVQELICRYMPECPASWQEITIHHLLTHTSGIPNFTDFSDYEATKATPTSPEQMVARFKDRPLDFPPGEAWTYSNSGYVVLGYIIEQVSGQSYEAFLQQSIFDPLRMTNTGYDHNDGSLATGYTGVYDQWNEPDYIDMSIPYAAGGLYSTVEDLYRWDQALYTEQLVSQELLDLMFSPQAANPSGGPGGYGYGWFVGEMNQHTLADHAGGIEGFATLIRRYPEDKVTIIVLSNRDTTNVGEFGNLIAKAVFER